MAEDHIKYTFDSNSTNETNLSKLFQFLAKITSNARFNRTEMHGLLACYETQEEKA